MITIEELRGEILIFEKKAQEEAKENGLFGKLQATINDALYKKKFEDVQKRLVLQQEEFNLQIRKMEENIVEKERELVQIVELNEKAINSVREQSVKTTGEPVFHRIEL